MSNRDGTKGAPLLAGQRRAAPRPVGAFPARVARRCLAASPHAWALGGLAAAVVAVALLVPSGAQAQPGVLDNVRDQYLTQTRAWLGPISGIARRLFIGLAMIEFTISGFLWLVRKDDLTEIAQKLMLKVILTSFCLMLITGARVWLPPLVNSFAAAGQSAGVVPIPAGPSEIIDLGVQLAFWTIDTTGLPLTPEAFITAGFALLSRVVIFGAFLWTAAMLLLAWVESYVALAGGVLFLGFAGFRATAGFAENYLNYLVFLGVRLFLFYLVLGVGTSVIMTTVRALPPSMNPRQMADVLAMSVVFALLCIRVPSSAASRVASGAQLGIGAAHRGLT